MRSAFACMAVLVCAAASAQSVSLQGMLGTKALLIDQMVLERRY